MRFVVNLVADVFDLIRCALIEDVGEIVDVTGGLEVLDRFSACGDSQRYDDSRSQTKYRAQGHRKIVQERNRLAVIAARIRWRNRNRDIAMRHLSIGLHEESRQLYADGFQDMPSFARRTAEGGYPHIISIHDLVLVQQNAFRLF